MLSSVDEAEAAHSIGGMCLLSGPRVVQFKGCWSALGSEFLAEGPPKSL